MSQLSVETMANLLSSYASTDALASPSPLGGTQPNTSQPTSTLTPTLNTGYMSCGKWVILVGGICLMGGVLAFAVHYAASRQPSRRMFHTQRHENHNQESYDPETHYDKRYEDQYTSTTYGIL